MYRNSASPTLTFWRAIRLGFAGLENGELIRHWNHSGIIEISRKQFSWTTLRSESCPKVSAQQTPSFAQ
jgi:hypothetical protein